MKRPHVDSDALLNDLLSIAERSPDEAFVLRVQKLALAEQRLRAAGQAALHRFVMQVAGSISIAAAFLLVGMMARADSSAATLFSGYAAAGFTLLLVWLCVDAEGILAVGNGLSRKQGASSRH